MYRKAFTKESTILLKKKNDPWDDETAIEQCFDSNVETTMEQHLDGLVSNRIYRGERTIINNYYWYYYFPSHSEDEFADSQMVMNLQTIDSKIKFNLKKSWITCLHWQILTLVIWMILNPLAPTPQYGQTHSNNSSGFANKFFECVWPFCGVGA